MLSTVQAGEKPKLLTILSTPEEESQMMALILSLQAVQQGAGVTVLLCGEAGYLGTTEGTSQTFAPLGKTPRDMVQSLLDAGADVFLCALFLPNRDIDRNSLREGVIPARPPEITALMLDPQTRLLSL